MKDLLDIRKAISDDDYERRCRVSEIEDEMAKVREQEAELSDRKAALSSERSRLLAERHVLYVALEAFDKAQKSEGL